MRVLIDGVEHTVDDASLSVFDWALVRGFGCFEVMRAYGGHPFRLQPHLDRMQGSAAALGLDPPPQQLEGWVRSVAQAGGNCLVRVIMTPGSRDTLTDTPARTIVMWEELPALPDAFRLSARVAPWHSGGVFSELTKAKTLSYAPNMAVSMAAAADGFDDALLMSRDGMVLEGPTFTVAWFTDGVLETPSLELGILESITRSVVLEAAVELGIEINEGSFALDRLLAADEAAVLSTVKEVSPLVEVDGHDIDQGPLTQKLRAAVSARIANEVSA